MMDVITYPFWDNINRNAKWYIWMDKQKTYADYIVDFHAVNGNVGCKFKGTACPLIWVNVPLVFLFLLSWISCWTNRPVFGNLGRQDVHVTSLSCVSCYTVYECTKEVSPHIFIWLCLGYCPKVIWMVLNVNVRRLCWENNIRFSNWYVSFYFAFVISVAFYTRSALWLRSLVRMAFSTKALIQIVANNRYRFKLRLNIKYNSYAWFFVFSPAYIT